jgi:hypothetical protein
MFYHIELCKKWKILPKTFKLLSSSYRSEGKVRAEEREKGTLKIFSLTLPLY